MFKSAWEMKLWLLIFITFLIGTGAAFADAPRIKNVSTPLYTNGAPARVGDKITVSFTFESDVDNPSAFIFDVSGFASPGKTDLNVSVLAKPLYYASGEITVLSNAVTGSTINGNTSVRVYATNSSGSDNNNITFNINNTPVAPPDPLPELDGTPVVAVTRGTAAPVIGSTIVLAGDIASITLKTKDTDIKSISLNMSEFGMNVLTAAPTGTAKEYQCSFTVPSGLAAGDKTITITLTDNAGQTSTATLVLNVASNGTFKSITIENTSGTNPVLPGDVLKFTITIANHYANKITISSDIPEIQQALNLDNAVNLTATTYTSLGQPAEYVFITPALPTTPNCTYTNPVFKIKSKENYLTLNRETNTTATFNKTLDLGGFQQGDAVVSSKDKFGNESASVATMSSTLVFSTVIDNSSLGGTTNVTVDLSPLGESTPLTLTNAGGTTYEGTYQLKNNITSMDGQSVSFVITAKNQNGNTLTKATNGILIDNVPPIIDSFTVEGETGADGKIIYQDNLTFKASVQGGFTASVDLTNLDSSGVVYLQNNEGSNNWQINHTVGLGTVNSFDFVLIAKDANGNPVSSVVTKNVDNNPPVYLTQTITNDTSKNPPYMIIGDQITLKLYLSNTTDNPTVAVDLSSLGNLGVVNMDKAGNIYSTTFTIATGSLNNGATFPVNISDPSGNSLIDGSGNSFIASFCLPLLDQNPPDPLSFTYQITNRTDKRHPEDISSRNINSWSTINWTLTYNTAEGDNATTAIRLPSQLNRPTTDSRAPGGSYPPANVVYYLNPSNLYKTLLAPGNTSDYVQMYESNGVYKVELIATETINPDPGTATNASFTLIMTDKSGNIVEVVNTQTGLLDIRPPVITNVTVTTPSHAGPLIIGDEITFTVTVENSDGQPRRPLLDLSSLDSSLGVIEMGLKSGINPYVYSHTMNIAAGTLSGFEPASFPITVYDSNFNYDATYTQVLYVDNAPPSYSDFRVTTGNNNTKVINYTNNSLDLASVTFSLVSKDSDLIVTYDMTAIGGPAEALAIQYGPDGNGDYIYATSTVTAHYPEQFSSYTFIATATDSNNNRVVLESNTFEKVDCLVPEFDIAGCLATITARAGDLSLPTSGIDVARIGDTISFYASMTNAIGATASIDIVINPQEHLVDVRELTFNPSKNRYETTMEVKAPGAISENGIKWGTISGQLNYRFSAIDDAGNVAPDISNDTSFNVQNVPTTISSFSLLIKPDFETTSMLNVGSGTVIEYLIASATLSDNRVASSAYIDLSAINGAPSNYSEFNIDGSNVNSKAPGINLNLYPTNDWFDTEVPITITITDKSGYTCATTASVIKLDTQFPSIVQAGFDGTELKVIFSEDILNFKESQWSIIGSTTDGLTDSIDLGDPLFASVEAPTTVAGDEATFTLTRDAQAKYVSWASTPIYVQAINSANKAAAVDNASNWLTPATFPIIITDYTIREEPEITSFRMEHNWDWPTASITFIVQFSHEMASSTSFVASEGALFVDIPDGISSINDISYANWYVFQKDDKFDWLPEGNPNNKTLRITLCDKGRDWVAANLTNNPEKSLKFAQYLGKRMIKNVFNKALKQYTIDAPFYVEDDRETNQLPRLNILSNNPKPVINLASGTLSIGFKDGAKLFTGSFGEEDDIAPTLAYPVPTDGNASRKHLNNISLFNLENNTSIALECKPIIKEYNPDFASTTVTIELTNNDLANILEFYNSYDTQVWGLQVNEGSFVDLWDQPNTKYKPTSPGTVEVIKALPTATATVIACSVSDPPPTKQDTGAFTFNFELKKSEVKKSAEEVFELPFLKTASPTAGIFYNNNRIASATLEGWSTRTVSGTERTIATFRTTENFTQDVNGVEAELRLYNLKDIFGNVIPVQTVSYVYDTSKQSELTATGFTTASEPFIIDNVLPSVATISPTLIGLTNISQPIFRVEFSEKMDTNVNPSLSIATSSATINCTFDHWEASGTVSVAVFKNNSAITVQTPNGTWLYNISGAMDLASNQMEPAAATVNIKSEIPRVLEDTLKIYTIRKNIDNTAIVVNKPFNFDASPDYIKIEYQYVDSNTENLPHTANFYNLSGELIGKATALQTGITATATLAVGDFTTVPTTNTKIYVKIQDCAGNETDSIGSLDYYGKAPSVIDLTIDNVASETATMYFFSPANLLEGELNLRAVFNDSYTGLHLLLASCTYEYQPIATMTINSNLEGLTLTSSFGSNLTENRYAIAFADEAGNLATGMTQRYLIADKTPPSVANVIPGPTDQVANCPVGMATFTVMFNELMDTTTAPTLDISTSTKRIAMAFAGWGPDGMTASFTNVEAINSQLPAGEYHYDITGAKDMTGNIMVFTPATCTTIIWPAGPGVSSLTIQTLMPDISDKVQTNLTYNPVKYAAGFGADAASATFTVDYINTPTYTPHELWIYNSSNDQFVASLSINTVGKKGTAIWNASGMPTSAGTYKFKMMDMLGNYYPDNSYLDQSFIIDTTAADVTSVAIDDGGIGQTINGIRYISPSVPATFTVTTGETEAVFMIIASGSTSGLGSVSGSATASAMITPINGSYTISLNDKLQQSWNGNDFVISVADLAGNINTADNASITIRVDSQQPKVVIAHGLDAEGNPVYTVGKDANFRIIFDSVMNRNIKPVVELATDTALGIDNVASLTFKNWVDDYTCEFITDGIFDKINYPVGTSTFRIREARDLAGNLVEDSNFETEVITKCPKFYATLESQQTMISDATLTNKPLSFLAEPGVATITILYDANTGHPYSLDHDYLIYDGRGINVASQTITSGATSITINPAFFGVDLTNYVGTFTLKLKDSIGNLSPTASTSSDVKFVIDYDGIKPFIEDIKVSGVSSASTALINYYNPDVTGNTNIDVVLNASETLRLVVYGTASGTYPPVLATYTYGMSLTNALTYSYTGNLSDIYGQNIPEGTYQILVADAAGNMSLGSIGLLIDKTAPTVTIATITDDVGYISSGNAGMATFSIQFDEALFDKGYQYLEIATTSYKIPCRFVRMTASDTALFETAIAVPNTILQGDYEYHVIATDLAGNQADIATGSIFVKSSGPNVSSIQTFSYQATTASDTITSGNDYHYNDMFSFMVEPYAATMSIKLAEEPDGDPNHVSVWFLKTVSKSGLTQEIPVASHTISVVNLMATFTWDTSTAPTVATEASYLIRIADANNDLSGVSYNWVVDNVAPVYESISFNSGVNIPASETIYINPYRHTNFEVIFNNLREHSPKLRVRNGISTDTYPLTAVSSTTNWKTSFRGKYSTETSSSGNLMPDGIYSLGLVDQAGNEASSGTVDIYKLVIDSHSPVIGTYTFTAGGQIVKDNCSPNPERPLVITLDTDEPLTATGACYLDVYNSGEVRVNRLSLTQNGGKLAAEWYGTNEAGETVADGKYSFKASDLCGNVADKTATIYAITAAFQNMGAVQTGSNTVDIWFNHPLDEGSINTSTITSDPAISINGTPFVYNERAIRFNTTNMTHGTTYTLSINSSLKDSYGSSISASSTTAVFTADVKGPELITYNFDASTKQGEITLVFDQPLEKSSAENPTSYIITDNLGRIVPITYAILQGDNTQVMLVASGTFEEKAQYKVIVPGVKDELGNSSCGKSIDGSFTFIGRDMTPPTFKVSAFSNAANENDIIVIAVSNEELIRVPTLTIKHGSASPISLSMQKSSTNSCAFMAAASLKASNGKSGSLVVNGQDLSGNSGVGEGAFTIATVATKSNVRLATLDGQFSLTFDENSLKSNATIRILQRSIEKDEIATGTLETALQGEYASIRGARASVTTTSEAAANAELTPITDAYEATLNSKKVNKGVVAALRIPETASSTTGLGLFYQKNGSWKFISSNVTAEKEIKAKITSTQVFAIMQDSVAPTIKLDESMDLSKNFVTSRPEFIGSIKDFGSGIDTNSIEVIIDKNTQQISVDSDGNFKFKPLSALTNGKHELAIRASDRTGNAATTGSMRFGLTLPFEFKQIIQYPNPARTHTTIRVMTNSTAVNCHIKMKIYDVAGHKVADFDESDVVDKGDGAYEIRWNLTNLKGKRVANGTYIAKLEATNPETGKKEKKTLKLAVLR